MRGRWILLLLGVLALPALTMLWGRFALSLIREQGDLSELLHTHRIGPHGLVSTLIVLTLWLLIAGTSLAIPLAVALPVKAGLRWVGTLTALGCVLLGLLGLPRIDLTTAPAVSRAFLTVGFPLLAGLSAYGYTILSMREESMREESGEPDEREDGVILTGGVVALLAGLICAFAVPVRFFPNLIGIPYFWAAVLMLVSAPLLWMRLRTKS